LIKDYDLEVHYHPGKANVVADALSQKTHCNCLTVKPLDISLCHEIEKLGIEIVQQGSVANTLWKQLYEIRLFLLRRRIRV
jgi:hypothetical protein